MLDLTGQHLCGELRDGARIDALLPPREEDRQSRYAITGGSDPSAARVDELGDEGKGPKMSDVATRLGVPEEIATALRKNGD